MSETAGQENSPSDGEDSLLEIIKNQLGDGPELRSHYANPKLLLSGDSLPRETTCIDPPRRCVLKLGTTTLVACEGIHEAIVDEIPTSTSITSDELRHRGFTAREIHDGGL